jgi:hypothetical protein
VLISLAGWCRCILVGGGLSLGIERIAKINTIVSFYSVFIAFGVSITRRRSSSASCRLARGETGSRGMPALR